MVPIGVPHVALPSESVQMQAVGLGGMPRDGTSLLNSLDINLPEQQSAAELRHLFCGCHNSKKPASLKFLVHMTHVDSSIAKPRLHLVLGRHLVS